MPLNLKLNECIVNMNEFGIESFHESIKKNFLIFLITTYRCSCGLMYHFLEDNMNNEL